MKTTDYIRFVLTCLLIICSYNETGIFTAVLLFLICLRFEILDFLKRKAREADKKFDEALKATVILTNKATKTVKWPKDIKWPGETAAKKNKPPNT